MSSRIITALLPVLGIAWILDLPARLGMVVITEQYLATVLGVAVLAGFLAAPRNGLWRWPDVAFGVLAMSGWLWLAWNYEGWLLTAHIRGPEKWVPALIAIAGTVEATRRNCGLVLAVLGLIFMAYGFLGWLGPGIFEGAYLRPARYLLYIYSDSNGVPGLVLNVAANQILGFVVFGVVLTAVGGSDAMTRLAMALMGHRRGGPAKVAILASSLFGTLSGSTVANVMSTGVVTIPMMKRAGFPSRHAAAIEAVASNGGQIAPPVMGATAFVIAEFLQVGYADVVVAAFLPAAFYYYLLYRQVDRFAAAHGIMGEPRENLPRVGGALAGAWPLIAPLGVLIWFLFVLGYSPGKAALYSAISALALNLIRTPREMLSLRFFADILARSGRTLIPVILVSAVAGIVIGTINVTGLGFALTLALGKIAAAGGVLALLAATATLAIILGVGMPTTGVYVVISVLLAPALVQAGVAQMSAHLFIFYFGLLSMLTPPVAIASYAAASIAGSDMWQTGVTGIKLAITAYLLPFVFALNPALVWQGTWHEIAVSVATVGVAGFLLAEVLANPRAYGGRVRRLGAGVLALAIGATTAVIPPASTAALIIAILGVVAAIFIARREGTHTDGALRLKPEGNTE
ncbi:TRAP transporter permease [Roseinatronobacter alkalisoli]|uniref:TRAP transporter fused permease subunit n=1 Tax=Roseinatronobacter alkalisoli TaxID=3028235 RepID=A0ABT5T7C0_9RHOB|nr:TRAP transporter fused permease subunit [Roseinatronobacter sp. HJB301]MDD7970944.1 TRAP transporter fused permease subunit [Roseinatronobacter sp. HJB301]